MTSLGRTGGSAIEVDGQFSLDLDTVRDTWTATLPAVFG